MHSFKHSPGPNFITANSSLASHPKPHPLCPLHHRHFGSFLHSDLFSAVWWFWHGNATVSPSESLSLNRVHQVSAVTEARRGKESTGMPLTSLNKNWDSFFFPPHVNWKLFSVSIILIGGMKPEDVTHNYKCNDWKVWLKGLGEWVRKKTLTDPKIFLRLKYLDAFLQWWYQWWIFNTA